MSLMVDKRREDNHTREEYGFARNLRSLFFDNSLKKYLLLKFKNIP